MFSDPGYSATSAMLVQSALCIVNERDSLPPRYVCGLQATYQRPNSPESLLASILVLSTQFS